MTDARKKVCCDVGKVFSDFIKGKPFNVNTLRDGIVYLNGLQIDGHIESNDYDDCVAILEDAIAFFEP